MDLFIQQHRDSITGSVSGWDRLRFRGTLRMLANVVGLGRFMSYTGRLLKHFGQWAHESSQLVRAASLATAESVDRPVVHLASASINKEEVARQLAERDGVKEGLIGVLTCVEPCGSYDVRSHRHGETGRLELIHAPRKCQHLYHYYLHPIFGFMHVRLQTWLPFNQFICINGREWLGRQMDAAGIGSLRRENCFAWIADVAGAQRLLEDQVRFNWEKALGQLALAVNPALKQIVGDYRVNYYWSLEESEWATDVMFRSERELSALYPSLIRHGMQSFSSPDVMRFLGHRVTAGGGVHGQFAGEVTSDTKQRPEGLRIKHRVKSNSLKMYNKQGSVLRVETTLNNMREIKAPRRLKDRQGKTKVVWRMMRKGVADIARRAKVSHASNRRYLDALAVVNTPTPLKSLTEQLSRPIRYKGLPVRGLNLLGQDAGLLEGIGHGQFLLSGFRNRDVQSLLFGPASEWSDDPVQKRQRSGRVTRLLRMLRAHGLIEKVSHTHRYLVTPKGRQVITALIAARQADIAKLTNAA
jgi:hypothetical protein